MTSLLVVFSYHHHNTEKVAEVFAQVLDAQITTPLQIDPNDVQKYDLVGFGSGIDSDKHYKVLLDLADKLPTVTDKKAFIFSTSGVPVAILGNKFLSNYSVKAHATLRNKLESKGYVIVDEFICPGFNTNSFLKYFGGLNKKRPSHKDLERAKEFASKIKGSV
jgi:flavodoxin